MKTSLVLIDDFEVLAQIGDGGQANVYLCHRDHKLYAVKVFNSGSHRAEAFLKETRFLSILNHQNLIKMIDSKSEVLLKYQDGTEMKKSIIVLQYASNGDLFQYISITKGFKAQYCKAIIKKILNGLEYLKEKGISHRDIKPQNILFDHNFDLKISDFGLSALSQGSQKNFILKTKVGTQGFKAPEIDQGSYNGQKADIFSVGIILFVLYVGSPPFMSTKSTDKIYKHIINKNYQKFWSIHQKSRAKGFFSQGFKRLMNSLLSNNPYDRPSIQQILQQQWINQCKCTNEQLKNELTTRFLSIINQSQVKKNIRQKIQKFNSCIVNGTKEQICQLETPIDLTDPNPEDKKFNEILESQRFNQ